MGEDYALALIRLISISVGSETWGDLKGLTPFQVRPTHNHSAILGMPKKHEQNIGQSYQATQTNRARHGKGRSGGRPEPMVKISAFVGC